MYKRQALVIAGLAAEGYTTVTQIGYIQRGYERFDEKLRALGGKFIKSGGIVLLVAEENTTQRTRYAGVVHW